MENLYEGIVIPSHRIIDETSKIEAIKSLSNWDTIKISAEAWIAQLDEGKTIQPSKFSAKSDGNFTHAIEYWQSTHFVCADGDNIKNVEFLNTGEDKNPDGIEAWTESGLLSEKFPGLLTDAYAVGESVSSMLTEPLHRRFRLIFIFDEAITNETHYRQILLKLAEKYPIIPMVSRSPAQPVFGNARKGFDFHICGNILKLQDYPQNIVTEKPKPKPKNKKQQELTLNESLEDFLKRHNITYTLSKDSNKYYVDCPYQNGHTGQKQGATDSYVFDDGTGWAFYCSHAHCINNRTWDAFKKGYNIKNGINSSKRSENGSEKKEKDRNSEKINHVLHAEYLMEQKHYFFTQENIHRYNEETGIYNECNQELKHDIRQLLSSDAQIRHTNEITAHIRDMCFKGEKGQGVCFSNGVLNLESLKLSKHTPENYFLQGFPVSFDENATSERFDEWLQEVLPDKDCQKSIFEMIGSFFDPDSNLLQTGFLLTGSGSNGKSLLLEILSILIGEDNICRTPFSQYGKDRFAVSTLVNKAVAMDDDLQTDQPLTSTIKPLITARNLQCERKYENAFNFKLEATFIGAINGSPSATDTSSAFWRRWCVIPFEQTFKKNALFARELIEECSKPETLGGILNTAIICYKKVLETGQFTIPDVSKAAVETMQADNNHVITFLEETTTQDPEARISRIDIRNAYIQWCEDNGYKHPYSDRRFYTSIRENPGISEVKSNGIRMFGGLKF